MTTLRQRAAELIRTRRHQLGLTQAQVAEKASMSDDQLANYEAGRQLPAYRQILRLCKALRCRPNTILPREDEYSD